jgi:hypothetical protein
VDLGMKNPVNLSSSNKAFYCISGYGPIFSGSDVSIFWVPADANTDISSNFNVNDTYKDLPKAANGKCMYIDGDSDFQISEVEVYKVIPK